jgi:adenylate cyclase
MRHSAARPTTDLTAYDLYLRALAVVPSSTSDALRLLEQAIERDSNYGPALARSAICHMLRCQEGRSDDPKSDSRKGADFARRALQVGGEDPGVLANAAFVLAYFGEDITAMMALVDRALVLNPSYARGWHISGNIRLWAGYLDQAIEHIEASLRLSPRIRVGLHFMVIGAARFLDRRFDEAIPKLLLGVQEFPNHAPLHRCLAACYAHMGLLDEAREVITRLRVINPVIVPSIVPYRNPEHRELFLSGLRLAAGETA